MQAATHATVPPATLKRNARYAMRATLRRITTIPRHAHCGRYRIGGAAVQLRLGLNDDGAPLAHYSGLQHCGAIWTCPTCSPRIRQQRAADLDHAAATWLTQHGTESVLMLTLTMPHDMGERLDQVLASTRRAFSALVSGRAWQTDKQTFGLRYYVRAHDITVGAHGWHPHLHLLLFCDGRLEPAQLERLRLRLFERWSHSVASLDRRAPSWQHGVTLEAAHSREDAAAYICQVVTGEAGSRAQPVAMELARSDLKTSHHAGQRTPWQVLADYTESPTDTDRALWQEYERATRRVNAIRWANGLRAAVQLSADEQTDEQIVMQAVGGDVVHTFTRDTWRSLRDALGFYTRSAAAELLDAAEVAGADGVANYLAALQVRQALDTAERRLYGSPRPGRIERRRAPHRQPLAEITIG